MVDKVLFSSDADDWQTPDEIIEFVQFLFGGEIDLDPCSNLGTPNVPAKEHYTIEDDGLSRAWWGKVYMNSPYGREIKVWAQKASAEFWMEEVDQLVALVPVRSDTQWWKVLTRRASCVLFIEGRLQFKGAPTSAPFPSALICLGVPPFRLSRTLKRFRATVSGRIWEPYRGA